jgi:hypothetical protein
MDIASQITVSLKPEAAKSFFNQNTLNPGTILKLKIIDLRGDRAVIDFGNFRATADIRVPVVRGQELHVKILESGRQLKMGVLNPGHQGSTTIETGSSGTDRPMEVCLKKAQTDLKQFITQVEGASAGKFSENTIVNIFKNLASYYEPIDLTKEIISIVSRLESYLKNSGFFFEKSLEQLLLNSISNADSLPSKQLANLPEIKHLFARDLKANLLALTALIEGREELQKLFSSRVLASLKNSINILLKDIIQQQGRAVGRMDTLDPLPVFEYLLPLESDGQTAKLKVYYQEKRQSGSKKGFRISLLLSMDRLGDLRTDFLLFDDDLTITFFVQNDSIRNKIQQNFPELQKFLDGSFNQILMKAVVSEKKISDFDRDHFQPAGDRQVDLRV